MMTTDQKRDFDLRIGKLAEATSQCQSAVTLLQGWAERMADSAERIEKAQAQDRDLLRQLHADHERRIVVLEKIHQKEVT